VGAWVIGEAAHRPILVIYDQVEVKVRHPQLPCGLTPASLDAFGTPRSTSLQAMVAKRRSLVQRFPGTCFTQFIRHYNWICSCINKKRAEVATNCKQVACADTTGDPLGAAFGFSRLCLNRCRTAPNPPLPEHRHSPRRRPLWKASKLLAGRRRRTMRQRLQSAVSAWARPATARDPDRPPRRCRARCAATASHQAWSRPAYPTWRRE
jgi:hypothetical protein